MKIKNDFTFLEQYRLVAEEYISYKRSMGFSFGYDDQKKCDELLRYLYANSSSNDVTELTKGLVDGYLAQFNDAKHFRGALIGDSEISPEPFFLPCNSKNVVNGAKIILITLQ